MRLKLLTSEKSDETPQLNSLSFYLYHRKVSNIQENLQTVQSQRIGLQMEITQAQENLNNLNVELQEYRRGDPKYVEILKKVRSSICQLAVQNPLTFLFFRNLK